MNIKPVIVAMLAILLWWIGPIIFNLALEGLSSASAYASIMTWTLVAFAALIFKRDWKVIPVLLALYVIIFCVAAGVGSDRLYTGIGELPWPSRIVISSLQSLIIASPVVFAWGFDAFRDRLRGVNRHKD